MQRRDQVSIAGTAVAVLLGGVVAAAGAVGSSEVGGVAVFVVVAVLAYVINWVVFVPSYRARTEHWFDLTGSVTYVSVTLVALALSDDVDARAVLVAVLVVVWAGRLGTFLFRRVRRDGRDGRFDRIKTDGLRFFMTWTLQGLWVVLTLAAGLAAITAADREDFGVWAIVGVAVWLCGFGLEVVADAQKRAFRADAANDGRFITTGVWAWSRHPNYFGEITLWVGIALISVPVLSGWRWLTLISPIFVVVLLTRISGIPMLEHRAEKRWGSDPEFRSYTDATPVLVPRPPRR